MQEAVHLLGVCVIASYFFCSPPIINTYLPQGLAHDLLYISYLTHILLAISILWTLSLDSIFYRQPPLQLLHLEVRHQSEQLPGILPISGASTRKLNALVSP